LIFGQKTRVGRAKNGQLVCKTFRKNFYNSLPQKSFGRFFSNVINAQKLAKMRKNQQKFAKNLQK